MPGSFIDTNVLIYLASGDPLKANRAEEIIGGGGVISVQVLNELANVARCKMRMSWPELQAFTATIRDLLTFMPLLSRSTRPGWRWPSAARCPFMTP